MVERIGDTVAVIDTATRKTVARIEVGKAPKRLLVVEVPKGGKGRTMTGYYPSSSLPDSDSAGATFSKSWTVTPLRKS